LVATAEEHVAVIDFNDVDDGDAARRYQAGLYRLLFVTDAADLNVTTRCTTPAESNYS
jgi:hypothetical protein